MPVIALSPHVIRSLSVPLGKSRVEYCDKNHPGLLLEMRATSPGTGTWYVRYKIEGKTRYSRIGSLDDVSLAAARKQASILQAEIRLGSDPSAQRRQVKQTPTLETFVYDQYLPYIRAHNRSHRSDEQRLTSRLLPAFGQYRLHALTRKQLTDFHQNLREEGLSPATCDHFIKLMRRILNQAVAWEVIEKNPIAKFKLFNAYNRVEHMLDDEQMKRLLAVLETHPNRQPCQVARFLLSTGCRLNEALTARWQDISLTARLWRIPSEQSKSKKMRPVPLNAMALALLEELQSQREPNDTWLFMNRKTDDRLKTMNSAWNVIRAEAELPWLRMHDLRHNFASIMVNSGRTLYEVQELLGHSCPQVTQRYAHLNTDRLMGASETAADKLRQLTPRLLPAPVSQ